MNRTFDLATILKVEPGIYQHYKGPRYEVFGLSRHSETEEYLVVYRPLYGEAYERGDLWGDVWVRPAAMFLETVSVEGKTLQRFAKVED